MRAGGAAISGCVLILSGCSHYNAIYNADRLYREAELHRRAGRDSISEVRYQDVVRKTGQAYRARPDSDWAGEALFLLGRSKLRLGDLRAAQAALEEASARTGQDGRQAEIMVYVAVVRAELGDDRGALDQVNEALQLPLEGATLAEAHLLRGRLLLKRAYADQGWWDLDRAGEIDPSVRVEAGLERLRWAVYHGDRDRSSRALEGLLAAPAGGARLPAIGAYVHDAEDQWGPAVVADMLAGASESRWGRAARGRIALERARLLDASGDTAKAAEQAWRVAGGLGESAATARLQLATWRFIRARDLSGVYAVRIILLPVEEDARVASTLAAVDELERFASIGLDEPLGWFAAAELARDLLQAEYLARGLFLAYADGAPEDDWAPKALLAALEVSSEEGDRAWLRGRLEAHATSPYVLAAHGGPAAGFEALEEELETRLRDLAGR